MEKQVITKLFNQGIKLHRLVKDRKQPLHEGSFKGESLKDLIIHNGNIGVICGELSGIIVLDLDIHNENEPSGFDSLKQMEQDNEKLPQTYTVDTPTGGRHLYFKLPHSWNGTRFYPKLDKYPQIDFRNNGQYVVAESSTLDYTDEKNTTPVSGEYINNIGSIERIPYAPEWLLKLFMKNIDPRYNKPRTLSALGSFCNLWGGAMKETPTVNYIETIVSKLVVSGVRLSAVKRLAWYVNQTSVRANKQDFQLAYDRILDPIKQEGITLEKTNKLGEFCELWLNGAGEGGRNIYMTSMVGRLFASGMNHQYVYDIARVINRTACEPPLDTDEFCLIYNSMLKTEQRRTEELKQRLEGVEQ